MLDPDISTDAALRHLHMAEHDVWAVDRRRFLQLVGMGVGAGFVAGPGTSLLDAAVPGLGLDPAAWAAGPIGPNDGVLVVIGMYGGNDGLNTVVPVTDGRYYDQHGSLAIPGNQTLALDGETGLHPALTEMKRFWDAGQLAVVEGIGYPNPDLSHFNSMAKWMAGRPTGLPTSGWIGRWLDGLLGGTKDLYAAAEIGTALPLHLQGEVQRGTVVPAGRPAFGAGTDARDLRQYATVRAMNPGGDSWAGRVGQAFSDQLDVAKRLAPVIPEELPDDRIVARLEVAARLINANLGFRVLTAGWNDFDSHAGQPDMHPARMQELNAGLARFFELLHPDWATRVTVVTFSEFGRTSHANDGQGSDHGTAAPHFVLGANVRGGRYGQRPSLAGLRRWERMAHHVDFRDYFGSVLDGWMGGGGSDVFGRTIQDLGLFAAAPGTGGGVAGAALADFVPLSPARIYDTRSGVGGRTARIGPGETVEVQVTGNGGVPAAGVRAVAVNVTSVNTTANTNFRVFPTGIPLPASSSLNPRPGRAIPNMAVVGVGTNGRISVYNHNGHADCIVDVMGFFRSDAGSKLAAMTPARILDTRDGNGAPRGRVRGGTRIDLQVTGRGGVPASGVDAVVLNVGSVNPTTRGFVSVWPFGEPRPGISNLNYTAGMNVPNLVMCKLGAGGKISIYANAGELDLIADVVGCYAATGSRQVPVTPVRLLDTREGNGAPAARVGGGSALALQVTGRGGVPANASAVILNVTGVGATRKTFVTAYPDGEGRPNASSLNLSAGQTTSNLVVAKVGAGGRVRLYNHSGSLDLVADVTAYFR